MLHLLFVHQRGLPYHSMPVLLMCFPVPCPNRRPVDLDRFSYAAVPYF
jgi:hypothetical protein